MVGLLSLIEELLRWQWINCVMDGIGFAVGAVVILVLYIKIVRLESRINGLVR